MGWISAQSLQIGDIIWTNGEPEERYKDKEFLLKCKEKGMKYAEIAEACNISERTIRYYFKLYNINEGKTGSLKGEDNPNYKGDKRSVKGSYMEMKSMAIERYHKGMLPENIILNEKGLFFGKCEYCDNEAELHIHHRDHLQFNNAIDNHVFQCALCHRVSHSGYTIRHVKKSSISNIYASSCDETFDVCIPHGNYVANGFIIKGAQ